MNVKQGTVFWVSVFRITDFWSWMVIKVYFTESKKEGFSNLKSIQSRKYILARLSEYWFDKNVHSGFSLTSYRKPWTFLANLNSYMMQGTREIKVGTRENQEIGSSSSSSSHSSWTLKITWKVFQLMPGTHPRDVVSVALGSGGFSSFPGDSYVQPDGKLLACLIEPFTLTSLGMTSWQPRSRGFASLSPGTCVCSLPWGRCGGLKLRAAGRWTSSLAVMQPWLGPLEGSEDVH